MDKETSHPPIRVIAHRGLIIGPDIHLENHPINIRKLLDLLPELYIEIDVWYDQRNDLWYLGHEHPDYLTVPALLDHPRLYLHAKNLATLVKLRSQFFSSTFFFHASDAATITSRGEIWTNIGNLARGGIAVINDQIPTEDMVRRHISIGIFGVCTDYPYDYNYQLMKISGGNV